MTFIPFKPLLLPCCLCGLFLMRSEAAVTAIVSQQGDDVAITVSGSVLTDGLLPVIVIPTTIRAGISPQLGGIGFGSITGVDSLKFQLPSVPMASYGAGPARFADLASGSVFGIGSSSGMGELSVPTGYVSGSALSSSMTFLNSTLVSLGLSPGSHVISWSVGTETDNFTVVVIPEPATGLLITLSATVLACSRRRRARRA